MIQTDFYSLLLKVGSVQSSLTSLFDPSRILGPIFKRDEKYCKTANNEPDTSQTRLIENTGYNSYGDVNEMGDSLDNDSVEFDSYLYFDLFGKRLESEDCGTVAEKSRFEEVRDNQIKETFGLEDIGEYENHNIMVFPDNRFAMINRICPHCGIADANINEWKERKYKNKENIAIVYYTQAYICNKCGKWFSTPVNFDLNKEMKEKISLDKKIREIHANTDLSFDKIAEILEITMNVNVSHEYIRNVIQVEHDDFVYQSEVVMLPDDFKKKRKTSKEREVTDIGILVMFKKKDLKISGEIEVDELFTDVGGRRYYLVNVFANEIRDIPIAVAIVNTRHYDVMNKFFDFIFENNEFKALTSDMLGVYKKISENEKAEQQKCIFHWMKYNGKKIFDETKKEKISKKDKMWYVRLFSEMCEILRNFDEEIMEKLVSDFKNHLSNIPDFMKKIVDKFFKDLESLTKHSKVDNMVRTTSKAENFHSLPQIRHKKHTSKKTYPLLLSLSSTIKFRKLNYRTLKYRI